MIERGCIQNSPVRLIVMQHLSRLALSEHPFIQPIRLENIEPNMERNIYDVTYNVLLRKGLHTQHTGLLYASAALTSLSKHATKSFTSFS